jgi:hypothetical protein
MPTRAGGRGAFVPLTLIVAAARDTFESAGYQLKIAEIGFRHATAGCCSFNTIKTLFRGRSINSSPRRNRPQGQESGDRWQERHEEEPFTPNAAYSAVEFNPKAFTVKVDTNGEAKERSEEAARKQAEKSCSTGRMYQEDWQREQTFPCIALCLGRMPNPLLKPWPQP